MNKVAILVFELGHLQVFYYQTLEAYARKDHINEYFWIKKQDPKINGPFSNIYLAVTDYTVALNKPKYIDNIIHLDFKTKKRITK